MPNNNTELGTVSFNVQAKITGYEEGIKGIQEELKKLSFNSSLSKSISDMLSKLKSEVATFSRDAQKSFSTQKGLNQYVHSVERIEQMFIRIAEAFQRTTSADIPIVRQIEALVPLLDRKNELEDLVGVTAGKNVLGNVFIEGIKGATELLQVLKELHPNFEQFIREATDMSDVSEQFDDEIRKALNTAKSEAKPVIEQVNTLTKAYEQAAEAAKQLENLHSKVSKNDEITSQVFSGMGGSKLPLMAASSDTRERIRVGLSGAMANIRSDLKNRAYSVNHGQYNSSQFQNVEAAIEQLNDAILEGSVEKIKDTTQQLQSKLKEARISSTGFLEAAGLSDIQIGNGENLQTALVQQLTTFDPTQLRDQFLNNVLAVFQDLGLEQILEKMPNLMELVDAKLAKGDIEGAKAAFKQQMESYRDTIVTQMKQASQTVTEKGKELEEAKKNAQQPQERVNTLQQAQQQLREIGEVRQLKQQVVQLEEELKRVKAELEQMKKTTPVEGSRKYGEGLGNRAKQNLAELTQEAQKYQAQLERVEAVQGAVTKMTGFINRWFSVYAVVRMVSKALSSIKNTIAELDKTMTEIAIVTNMNQDELWGQIPKYTALAQKFGASISGVYQVSQLYYQQGLQTNDVMALTEQTLKMARISGLAYADATNYMTNAVRSFKLEMTDSQTIVDVYSAIAATSATSTKELAIAMSKTASSAQAVGSSFENTTAMIAVMMEATREAPEKISGACKKMY